MTICNEIMQSQCRLTDTAPSLCLVSAPEGVKTPALVLNSDSSVNVSWSAPEEPNGVLTSYRLMMSNGGAYSVVYKDLGYSYHVTNLTAGQTYCFYVVASTSAGGTKSNTMNVTIPGTYSTAGMYLVYVALMCPTERGESNVPERFKALTRSPEVPSSDPLPGGLAGVYSHLASLPANWGFLPLRFIVFDVALKSPLSGAVIAK